VIADEQYGVETVRLSDGDVFIFYTDGSYEATNAAGEQFGLARLEKALRTHIYESPGDILPLVLRDIQAFIGGEPVEDDICLVAVHVTAKAPKPA
jgi:phosphoserine phosphatase RsbU/P